MAKYIWRLLTPGKALSVWMFESLYINKIEFALKVINARYHQFSRCDYTTLFVYNRIKRTVEITTKNTVFFTIKVFRSQRDQYVFNKLNNISVLVWCIDIYEHIMNFSFGTM